MSTPLTNQLLGAVAAFVRREIPLAELRRRTVPEIYTADASGEPDAEFIADELVLRFAEADHGDWSDDELRELLSSALAAEIPTFAAR